MRKRDLQQNADAVKAAVRQVADEYLTDPNINSVGVGHRLKDGKRTDDLVLQFTVGQKVAPEAVRDMDSREIPKSINANGIQFDTDVVEREFTHHPVAVQAGDKDERKRRVDPMVPGISVGNVHITAGTLGCLVKEKAGGKTRMLSNWHVLNGEGGQLGDQIVQPGAFDDNRTADNVCGKLVRSFLGLAGDCAIASIDGRAAGDDILGLSTQVARLGDAQLDDRVVKSGRTTAVTNGVVTRVHTITKMTYGPNHQENIGGFEIGPDAGHPADNDEISMGGDSGSAWMAADENGHATDMMVGLHFAGDAGGPAEFAMACNASSVFEKLEIEPLTRERGIRAGAPVVASPVGYNPDFLPGEHIEVPAAATDTVRADIAPTKSGELVRGYTHFSLAMSASRRFCHWVAWNVDGNGLKQINRTGLDFVVDDAYDTQFQVDDRLYSHNHLDRGHIARRADLLWGSMDEANQANVDSFFFTNITPQMDDFNQSMRQGLWGRLEDAVLSDVDVDDLKVSVYGGPVFQADDRVFRGVALPREYWKVIAFASAGALKARAFVLTQNLNQLESLDLDEFRVFQVRLDEVEQRCGFTFPAALKAADTLVVPESLDERAPLEALTDIQW
jgi:endonuclease G, mitochondrial